MALVPFRASPPAERVSVCSSPYGGGLGAMGGSQARGRRLGVSLMRITIETREDTYEDALGVLRRAYGRHRVAGKAEESPAVPAVVDVSAGEGAAEESAEESGSRSASGAGRGDAGSRRRSGKATKKSAAGRTAARKAAAESPVSKSTVKRASGKKAARRAPADGRPGAPRKRSASGIAANTAPRGQSEAVRAWAQDQGMEVRARGRMPAKVVSAYLEAHHD